jgi:hypothetical protein
VPNGSTCVTAYTASGIVAGDFESVNDNALYATTGGANPAIVGYNSNTSGTTVGVYGSTDSTNLLPSGSVAGVYGQASAGAGVYGIATSGGTGVLGSADDTGVYGSETAVAGYGVYGAASGAGAYGLYGESTASSGAIGVYGTATYGVAVEGNVSSGSNAVVGINGGSGNAVYGSASTGDGVYGTSTSANGVYGASAYGGASGGYFSNTGSGGNDVGVAGVSTNNYGGYFLTTNGTYSAYFNKDIYVNGASLGPSDRRFKKNIAAVSGALDQLLKLQGVNFEWIEPEKHDNATGKQVGFIAQDVEKVFPTWVKTDADGFKALTVAQIEGLEVESIRTLKLQNDLLAERVKELESGRRPLVSGIDFNGVGFGVGGVAVAGAILVSRRRREERQIA